MFGNSSGAKTWRAGAAVFLAFIFIINDISYAIPSRNSYIRDSFANLAPTTGIDPICSVQRSPDGKHYTIGDPDNRLMDRWLIMDIFTCIGKFLETAIEQDMENPLALLIPKLESRMRVLRMASQGPPNDILEWVNVRDIREIRRGKILSGFSLPVRDQGYGAREIEFSLEKGDAYLPMGDGKKMFLSFSGWVGMPEMIQKLSQSEEKPSEKKGIPQGDSDDLHREDTTIRPSDETGRQIENFPEKADVGFGGFLFFLYEIFLDVYGFLEGVLGTGSGSWNTALFILMAPLSPDRKNQEDASLRAFLKQIEKYPLLSAEEERELLELYRLKGDAEAFSRLVRSNLRLVVSIAKKFTFYGAELLVLIQEGTIGLMMGIVRYDPSFNTRLSTIAVQYIKREVRKALHENRWKVRIPRHSGEDISKISRIRARNEALTGRELSAEEMAGLTGLSVSRVRTAMERDHTYVSIDRSRDQDDEYAGEITEGLAAENTQLSLRMAMMDLETLLNKALEKLEKRSSSEYARTMIEIFKLYEGLTEEKGLNMEEIGRRFGVTQSRIGEIRLIVMRTLRNIADLDIKRSSRRSRRKDGDGIPPPAGGEFMEFFMALTELFENGLRVFSVAWNDLYASFLAGSSSFFIGGMFASLGTRPSAEDFVAAAKDNISSGKNKDALRVLEKAMDEYPENPKIAVMTMGALKKLDRYEDAIKVGEKALKSAPENIYLLNTLANVYIKAGRAEKAVPLALKITEMFPDDLFAMNILAEAFLELGKIEAARNVCLVSIEKSPENVVSRNMLAKTYLRSGNYAEAIGTSETTLAMFPGDIIAISTLMKAHIGIGSPEKAIKLGEKQLRKVGQNATIRNIMAIAYIETGQKEYAVVFAEETARQFPDDPAARNTLAKCYMEARRYGPALSLAQATVRKFPSDFFAWNTLVRFYIKTRRLKKAVETAEKAVKIFPLSRAAKNTLALAYMFSGKLEDAKVLAEEMLNAFPEWAPAQATLSRVYSHTGDHDAAVRVARRSFMTEPNNGHVRASLVRSTILRGDHDEAVDLVGPVSFIVNASSLAGDYAEDSNFRNSRKCLEAARAVFEKYVSSDPEVPFAANDIMRVLTKFVSLYLKPGKDASDDEELSFWLREARTFIDGYGSVIKGAGEISQQLRAAGEVLKKRVSDPAGVSEVREGQKTPEAPDIADKESEVDRDERISRERISPYDGPGSPHKDQPMDPRYDRAIERSRRNMDKINDADDAVDIPGSPDDRPGSPLSKRLADDTVEELEGVLDTPVKLNHYFFGDQHGELDGFRQGLGHAELAGADGKWTGGRQVLVQMGDMIDRGPKSLEAVKFIRDLQKDAEQRGGRVVRLMGNHEIMFLRGMMGDAHQLKYWFINGGRTICADLGISTEIFNYEEVLSNPVLGSVFREMVEDIMAGRLLAAYAAGDRLVTHAGALPGMSDKVKASDMSFDFNMRLIEAVRTGDFSDKMFNDDRFDSNSVGIFWGDYNLVILKSLKKLTVRQIVAHTPQKIAGSIVRYTDDDRRTLINVDVGFAEPYMGNRGYLVIQGQDGRIIAFDKSEYGPDGGSGSGPSFPGEGPGTPHINQQPDSKDKTLTLAIPPGIKETIDSLGKTLEDFERYYGKWVEASGQEISTSLLETHIQVLRGLYAGTAPDLVARDLASRETVGVVLSAEQVSEVGSILLKAASEIPTPASEVVHGKTFRDIVKFMARKSDENTLTKQQSSPIIAIGTDWITRHIDDPGLHNDALNFLLSAMRNFCERRNIPFIVGAEKDLASLINDRMSAAGLSHETTKLVVLAEALKTPDEKYSPSDQEWKTRQAAPGDYSMNETLLEALKPFIDNGLCTVVGVDGSSQVHAGYVPLVEMAVMALQISLGNEPDTGSTKVMVKPGKGPGGFYVLIPKAFPVDYNDYRRIYGVQRYA